MQEAPNPIRHAAFRSINKPLTFGGVERRLFFLSTIISLVIFNAARTFFGSAAAFLLLYGFSAWATKTDPQIIPILFGSLLNPKRARPLFDPAQFERCPIVIDKHK